MDEKLRENLEAAGCPDEVIRKVQQMEGAQQQILELRKYRRCLLEKVHREQERLTNLDYLAVPVGEASLKQSRVSSH